MKEVENKKPFAKVKVGNYEYDLYMLDNHHSIRTYRDYIKLNDEFVPFSGHRNPLKIAIKEYNYLKESELSGDEIRKGCIVEIHAEGQKIAESFTRNYEYGIIEAQKMIERLKDIPNWFNEEREKLIGRKIYYEKTPAIITTIDVEQCEAIIVTDNSIDSNLKFDLPVYMIDSSDEEKEEWLRDHGDQLKIELTSDKIWWWRKSGE
jgi:hypothetical protein